MRLSRRYTRVSACISGTNRGSPVRITTPCSPWSFGMARPRKLSRRPEAALTMSTSGLRSSISARVQESKPVSSRNTRMMCSSRSGRLSTAVNSVASRERNASDLSMGTKPPPPRATLGPAGAAGAPTDALAFLLFGCFSIGARHHAVTSDRSGGSWNRQTAGLGHRLNTQFCGGAVLPSVSRRSPPACPVGGVRKANRSEERSKGEARSTTSLLSGPPGRALIEEGGHPLLEVAAVVAHGDQVMPGILRQQTVDDPAHGLLAGPQRDGGGLRDRLREGLGPGRQVRGGHDLVDEAPGQGLRGATW